MSFNRIKNNKYYGPAWNAIGSTMYGANTFFLMMFVSRFAGVEAAGDFGICFTTAQLLYLLGIFGVSHYQITDYQEGYSFKVYSTLKFFSCAVMLVGAVVVCLISGYNAQKSALMIILTVYMLAHAISELYQSRLFQKNRMDLSGKCLFSRTFFSLVVFAVSLFISRNLMLSCMLLAAANLLSIILFSWLPCKRYAPVTKTESRGNLSGLVRACFPLFVSMLLTNLLFQMPKYTVEYYCNSYELGIFNMLFMLVQVINLISSFIFKPILKSLGDQVIVKNKVGILQLIGKQFAIIGSVVLVAIIGAWFLGTQVLGLFYNADLSAYRRELLLILLGGGLYALCQILYFALLLFRKQNLIFMSYTFCSLLFLFLCPFFVKKSGIFGAAVSFVIIHIILLSVYILFLSVQLRRLKHE